jgi:hypothetical protein
MKETQAEMKLALEKMKATLAEMKTSMDDMFAKI